jgi:peptide/nickel transport system substrate-binding protein
MKECEMGPEDRGSGFYEGGTSRRRFFRNAFAAGGVLAGGSALIAACGGTSSSSTASGAAAPAIVGKPKMGGAMRLGVSGGSSKDTLDPHTWAQQIDGARVCQLYDFLAYRDPDYVLKPMLGVEFTPNASQDQMLVKLRPGVTFHSGKPLTADDVVFSFERVMNPNVGAAEYGQFTSIIKRVEAVDSGTVRFTFKFPFNQLEDFAGSSSMGIIPVGWTEDKPDGTGPFKFQSFTPGQQSVFVRNENYWDHPKPYVDSVTIIDLVDDSARVNALVSGAVDAIDSVPYSLLPSVQQNSNLHALVSETGNWYPLTMRVDRPPFSDPRVRQAMRWLIDRNQMLSDAYGGHARKGNDLYAIDDPLYDHSIQQREQDIDKAKFLLKQAGYGDGLTVNLVTAPIENGVVQSSVVFAQQAKAAGVNVNLTKLDTTTFYNNQYMQRTFSVDWWDAESCLSGTADTQQPTSHVNETHYNDPQLTKWYEQAVSTTDFNVQKEIASKMQQQLWLDGGEIIVAFADNIDAFSTKVTGFIPNKTGFNLNYWGVKSAWFV